MMKHLKQNILSVSVSLVLFASVPVAFAWTAAPLNPPKDNVTPPVNVSKNDQNKLGKLGLGGLAIFGKLQLIDGTQGAGKVLVSDADGKASWVTVPNISTAIAGASAGKPTITGGVIMSGEKNLGSSWDIISLSGSYNSSDTGNAGGYIYKSGGNVEFAISEATGFQKAGTLTSTYQCAYTFCVKLSGSDVVIKTGNNSFAYTAWTF